MSDKNCLIIFAKEPQLGRVKTRLQNVLTVPQCLRLYKAFLRDTKSIVRQVDCHLKILAYDSVDGEFPYLKKIFPKFSFYRQKGSHLGTRLPDAIRWAKKQGAEKMVIIGSDAPTLPAVTIQQAFTKLVNHDIVLGPSVDGGYYLIGLKFQSKKIFQNITWSSSKVLQETLRNIKEQQLSVYLLKKWHDIDDAKSLRYLQRTFLRNGKNAQWTRKFLQTLPTE